MSGWEGFSSFLTDTVKTLQDEGKGFVKGAKDQFGQIMPPQEVVDINETNLFGLFQQPYATAVPSKKDEPLATVKPTPGRSPKKEVLKEKKIDDLLSQLSSPSPKATPSATIVTSELPDLLQSTDNLSSLGKRAQLKGLVDHTKTPLVVSARSSPVVIDVLPEKHPPFINNIEEESKEKSKWKDVVARKEGEIERLNAKLREMEETIERQSSKSDEPRTKVSGSISSEKSWEVLSSGGGFSVSFSPEIISTGEDKVDAETAVLEKHLKSREDSLAKISEELGTTLKENMFLKRQLAEREVTLSAMRTEFDSTKQREVVLMHEAKEAKSSSGDYEALLAEATEYSKQVADREKQLRELKGKMKRLEAEKGEIRAQVNLKESENLKLLEENAAKSKLEDRNRLLQARNLELQQLVEEKTKHVQKTVVRSDDILQELKETNEALNAKNIEIAMFKKKTALVESVKHERQVNEEKENFLRREIMKLRKQLENAAEEFQESEIAWREKHQRQKSLQDELEKRIEEMGESVQEATRPLLLQIQAFSKTENGRIESLKAIEQTLRSQLLELTTELEEERLISEETKREKEDLLIQRAKLSVQVKQFKEELANAQRVLVLRDLKISELTEEQDRLIHESTNGKESNNELSRILATTQEKTSRRIQELENEISFERHRRERLEMENENLDRRFGTLKEETRKEHAEKSIYSNIESEIFLSKLSSASHNKVSETQSMMSSTHVTGLVLNQLQQELRTKDGEIETLKKNLESLKETGRTLSDKIIELKSENLSLTKHQRSAKYFNIRYQIAVDLITEKDSEIKSLTEKLGATLNSVDTGRSDSTTKKDIPT